MRAKTNEHKADRRFQRTSQMFRDRVTEKDRSPGENKQCNRVTQTPRQPVLDDIADARSTGGNAGHCRDVIGLQRMLHS